MPPRVLGIMGEPGLHPTADAMRLIGAGIDHGHGVKRRGGSHANCHSTRPPQTRIAPASASPRTGGCARPKTRPDRAARRIVPAILERKYRVVCPPEYVDLVVRSFRDGPVLLRSPRYAEPAPAPEQRYKMIEEAAYYIAERHGFSGDSAYFWSLAEAEINAKLT